jgi:hypothetical protein
MADDDFVPSDDFVAEPDFKPDVRPTGREREHAYRSSLREGSPELPAGQGASGPDLSAESETPGKMASEYGQIAKGAIKGIPAAVSGGLAGDVESMGRGFINSFVDPNKPAVSKDTAIPTTTESGYLGPKGLNVMAPAANPLEAFGMGASSAAVPFFPKAVKSFRGRLPPIDNLPPGPPGGSMATVRPDTNVRLLPPEVPHTPMVASGSRDLGAAGVSPLEGVSPETITQLRKVFSEEGVTPYTVDQRLEEMSPHQFLGEFSPNTEAHMGAAAAPPGQGKLDIINSLSQRANEAKDRLRSTFDTAFGENENLAQLKRTREIDQKKASDPLYKAFKELPIPPTPELQELMPRLQAADAFGIAKHKAAVEGIKWDKDFGSGYGPIEGGSMPTAQSWDYVKRALDQKIADSFDQYGRATDYTRIYTGLKSELLNAIDNHPNPQVAGVWKQARQAYAGPAQISEAERLGKKIFTLDHDELPFLTAGYSDGQMAAFRSSVRKELENRLGRPGKQELRTINEVLAPNNIQKFRWIIGDEATDNLVRSVDHEFNMHGAPTRIHGGSQTALRTEANKMWTPQGASALEHAGNLIDTGVGLVTHPAGTIIKAGRKLGITKMDTAREARSAKIRDEAARIFTLQGPERDAVIRYLANPQPPRLTGGRVLHRATGGRAVGHKPSRPLLIDARKAPDGKFYIPDPKRPGKYLRVEQ